MPVCACVCVCVCVCSVRVWICRYWTTGFWQSRNRYANQSEVLAAARGYVTRGLPISLIVIDYYNWADLAHDPHWDYKDPNRKGVLGDETVRLLHSTVLHLLA